MTTLIPRIASLALIQGYGESRHEYRWQRLEQIIPIAAKSPDQTQWLALALERFVRNGEVAARPLLEKLLEARK